MDTVTEKREFQTDWELAQRASSGDEESWREIYERTSDRLFGFLCYQIGDRDEALDLLQETYMQAHQHLGSYRGEAPLGSWLRTIALRKSLDWRRKMLARFRRTVELNETAAVVEGNADEVHFESERAALKAALAKLSPRQRAALLLREWDGLSFREIAKAIGCKENTARVHHTRAKEKMRAALSAGGAPLLAKRLEGQQI